MSFWNKVKRLFGGGDDGSGPGDLPGHDPALVREVRAVVVARCAAGASFEAVDIADVVTEASGQRTVAAIRAACAVVEAMAEAGELAPLGYTQTRGIYHAVSADPGAYVPPRGGSSFPPPAMVVPRAPAAPRAPLPDIPDPLGGAEGILGLSPEDFRKRALLVKPWATPWIGRVDVIPPQSDERTAGVSRGARIRRRHRRG